MICKHCKKYFLDGDTTKKRQFCNYDCREKHKVRTKTVYKNICDCGDEFEAYDYRARKCKKCKYKRRGRKKTARQAPSKEEQPLMIGGKINPFFLERG